MNGMESVPLRIGPAGWTYDDWNGVVYPEARPKGFDPLEYLAQFFDCIEINSTFYRIPDPRMCAGWARRVRGNDRFRFTVKIYKGFTHETEPAGEGDAKAFLRGIEPIRDAGRLGCALAQFPWSFRNIPENKGRLHSLFRAFAELPLVLEVRHASWNEAGFYELLRSEGIGFCNIDQPLFRGSLGPSARKTSQIGYFRLHGQNYANWFREGAGRDERYDYLYSAEEIEPWAERIEALRGDVSAVYVIMNNHFRGKAACNALQLKARLSGGPVRVPPPLRTAYPQLGRISAAEPGQAELSL